MVIVTSPRNLIPRHPLAHKDKENPEVHDPHNSGVITITAQEQVHQVNAWQIEELELLKTWMEKANGNAYIHRQSCLYYQKRHRFVATPALIFSVIQTLMTSNSLPLTGSSISISREIGTFIVIISFLATFCLGLQNGFSFLSHAEKHAKAAIQWRNLQRDLKTLLISERLRGNDPSNTLELFGNKYRELLEATQTLEIPEKVTKEYVLKYEGMVALADAADGIESIIIEKKQISQETQASDSEAEESYCPHPAHKRSSSLAKFVKTMLDQTKKTPKKTASKRYRLPSDLESGYLGRSLSKNSPNRSENLSTQVSELNILEAMRDQCKILPTMPVVHNHMFETSENLNSAKASVGDSARGSVDSSREDFFNQSDDNSPRLINQESTETMDEESTKASPLKPEITLALPPVRKPKPAAAVLFI